MAEKKPEDAIKKKTIQQKTIKIKKEFNTLKEIAGNLRGELEFLRDSLKKSSNKYKKILENYKDDLKKKHEESDKKQPFSLSESDKKSIKPINHLINFSNGFVNVYNDRFKPVFQTAEQFLKFFFFDWDILKRRDYDLLKRYLTFIHVLNNNLPSNRKLGGEIVESAKRLVEQYIPTLDRKIIEFENIEKEIKSLQEGSKKTK